MPEQVLLALAQLNPAVGDIAGNAAKLRAVRAAAAKQGADLLLTPELFLSGYPPEDLVLKPSFQAALRQTVETLAGETADGGPAIILGTPWVEDGKLHNATLLLHSGAIAAKICKVDLPNYGPFDEKRVFAAGALPSPILFKGHKLGILICEDMWTPAVSAHLAKSGAEILLIPNGSPYETGKRADRMKLARERATTNKLPLVYLNQLGGQDELIFDGCSFVLNAKGDCVLSVPAWAEEVAYVSIDAINQLPTCPVYSEAPEATIYNALMLGLRDYVNKNGFPGAVLGLSGGIDSALVAALAVDALGPEKLRAVMLPSPYTSQDSLDDAAAVAKALGCQYESISIEPAMKAFDVSLRDAFVGKTADVTEENIQARCRGILLMALSNKFGPMVLSTGNKSEMSVGYSTLYGDLCGGFAVLKDLYKTQVYKVARWRNQHKPLSALGPDGVVIPERIFTKAPTAELRPGQKDQDSLPPYETLDDILECLIENDMGVREVVARGHDEATVRRVWGMLDRAEYKRRQGPPGTKITRRHMGRDRRYPITNKYRQ